MGPRKPDRDRYTNAAYAEVKATKLTVRLSTSGSQILYELLELKDSLPVACKEGVAQYLIVTTAPKKVVAEVGRSVYLTATNYVINVLHLYPR